MLYTNLLCDGWLCKEEQSRYSEVGCVYYGPMSLKPHRWLRVERKQMQKEKWSSASTVELAFKQYFGLEGVLSEIWTSHIWSIGHCLWNCRRNKTKRSKQSKILKVAYTFPSKIVRQHNCKAPQESQTSCWVFFFHKMQFLLLLGMIWKTAGLAVQMVD